MVVIAEAHTEFATVIIEAEVIVVRADRMKRLLLALVASAACAAVAHARIPLEDLIRPAQYDDMSISPDGVHLAAKVSLADRSVLVIVRRADLQVTAQVDPGKDGFVENAYWVSPRRVFVTTSRRFGLAEQPYLLPTVYALDADGRNRMSMPAGVIDPLVDDPEHVLIATCRKSNSKGCWSQVRRLRVDRSSGGEKIVDAPIPNANFLADSRGRVRFAWASDDTDNQQLYVYKDEAWVLLNDEAASGVEVVPIGTSLDDGTAYLWTEALDGPNAIDSYVFATGARARLLRDDLLDPAAIVWSFDGHEPIGAAYGLTVPTMRFFSESHPHAKLLRELERSFPEEYARVTSRTRDGALAVVTVTSDREPGRFYLLDARSGELTLLNRSRPWLDSKKLAAMQPITFKARDGLDLHGYLTLPAGGGGKNLPLVVKPHGGPYEIRDAWEYDEETQLLASRGYAVLQVNFRGSGGFGRGFVEAGYGEWGGAMQHDLTDATRWAIAEGVADPGRICLWGTSYGGYAALMGAAMEPSLYRCAIGAAGPYDLSMVWKWGDIQRSRWGRHYLETVIGRDQARLVERSPVHRVKDIQAAVMIVQGGLDARVSPEHAKAMRRALEGAGKPFEGYFPAELTHGIFGETAKKEYYRRVLSFLDRHLGGGAAGGSHEAGNP